MTIRGMIEEAVAVAVLCSIPLVVWIVLGWFFEPPPAPVTFPLDPSLFDDHLETPAPPCRPADPPPEDGATVWMG